MKMITLSVEEMQQIMAASLNMGISAIAEELSRNNLLPHQFEMVCVILIPGAMDVALSTGDRDVVEIFKEIIAKNDRRGGPDATCQMNVPYRRG